MLSNILTIDVEPWMCNYNISLLKKNLDRYMTVADTRKILAILAHYNIKATFFVLGLVAEWYPFLLEEILSAGHELALHGYSHKKLSSSLLAKELEYSKDLINTYEPLGFRAPFMYLPRDCLTILKSHGFKYDSSVYGASGIFSPFGDNEFVEIPVSSISILSSRYPSFPRNFIKATSAAEIVFGSGIGFSTIPAFIMNSFINTINKRGKPAAIFFHTWQISGFPSVPRSKQILNNFSDPLYRQRISERKLDSVLTSHRFVPASKLIPGIYR